MKKKLLSLVAALTLVFTGCAAPAAPATPAAPAAPEVIKIGVFGPTTGEIAVYGTAVENGVKLAFDEINAKGGINGKQVEVITYDSKGDKTEAVNIYNRLKDQDGVVAILGGTISGETLAIKELAKADNMPVLTPTATNKDVTLGASSVFRACYIDPYQGTTMAKFAIDKLMAKKVAVLYNSDDPYSEGIAVAIKEVVDTAGVTMTDYIGFTKTDVDFSAILTTIKANDPDVIFIPEYVPNAGKISTQAKAMGIRAALVGSDGWDGVEADYATQVEGYYFVNHYSKSDPAEMVQNFIKNYTTKYTIAPNALAALGYDSAYTMAKAITDAGATDQDSIVKALQAVSYAGVTGNIQFDTEGDPLGKDISIIQIVGGEQKLIEKLSVK